MDIVKKGITLTIKTERREKDKLSENKCIF